MFYENDLQLKNIKYKTKSVESFEGLNFDLDENSMNFNFSPVTYNFDYNSKSLVDGIGFHKLSFRYYAYNDLLKDLEPLPDQVFIKACWLHSSWGADIKVHRAFLIAYSSLGEIFYNRLHTELTGWTKIEGLYFSSEPLVLTCKVNDEDTLVLITEEEGMYTWNFPNLVHKINNVPSMSSVCVHNNRLYATTCREKRSIIFSDDVNLTNFNLDLQQGGSINLDDGLGRSNKVISFNGYLYVFRDFNIAKIVDYIDKDDFEVSQLYVSNGQIYDKTVCTCGNSIIYLASDGLYKFNGNSAKKLDLKINKFLEGVDNCYAVAGYLNGYYYLSCRLNYDDGILVENETDDVTRTNTLLKIDVESEKITILRGYQILGIFPINDIYKCEVCALIGLANGSYRMGIIDNSGMFFDNPLSKVWKTPLTDFGYPEQYKLLKEISLETKKDIVIEVITEKGKKTYNLKGKNCSQSIKPNIKCKKFAINIVSYCSDNYITGPKFVVGLL